MRFYGKLFKLYICTFTLLAGSSFFFFQLSNVNYSNSVISKLNKNQDAFSPSYKTAQFGTLFERLNR